MFVGYNAFAQTLCDYTYTTGSQYQLEVVAPTTGNNLPIMDPLYMISYANGLTLGEDSCDVGSPCSNSVYNQGLENSITTCISYTLTNSIGYVDTLNCCFIQVWNGQAWVVEGVNNASTWTCNPNAFGCTELMDDSGEFATEESCLASCDSIIYCNGYLETNEDNGLLTISVFDMTLPVTYAWDTGETTQSISPDANGVYYCYITDADGCDYEAIFTYFDFDFCDSTWYDANFTEVDGFWEVTLSGYISENLNDLTDTVLHSFTVTPSNDFMSQYGGAGSYPHSWTPEFALSLSTEDTLTICWSAIVYADGLNIFPQGYSEQCNMSNEQMLCDQWFWDGEAWARSTSAEPTAIIEQHSSTQRTLIKIIDVLGKETVAEKNKILFYIFDDGSYEKKLFTE